MGAAIFAVEKIGIHRDGSVTDVQEEQLTWQREKVFTGTPKHRDHILIQQSATIEFSDLFRSHIPAHAQLGCDLICTWNNKTFAVSMEIAEIGEDGKSLGLEAPLPDIIWKRETTSLRIMLTENGIHLQPPPVCSATH